MGVLELILIGVGLSMDAFAVSVCKGLNMKKLNYRHGIIIALFFGIFQGMMPLIGWILGKQFERFITPLDHWIAFGLLAFIGTKMIYESIKCNEEVCKNECNKINYKELFILAIATSIDALAVGITFAFLQVNIFLAISIITVITFVLSFIGVIIGNKFGSKLKNKAEIAGGIILIIIGVKILIEHLLG